MLNRSVLTGYWEIPILVNNNLLNVSLEEVLWNGKYWIIHILY